LTAPRRISAGDTFFRKFFISGVFVTGSAVLVYALVRLWLGPHERGLALIQSAANVALFPMALEAIWRCAGLKRVVLTGDSLRVSNFVREIAVPLSDVGGIDDNEGKIYRVVIRFARETPFGRRINFSPIGWSHPRPHPIIAELRAAVAAAKPS
jgi:hypothetical protein